VIALGLLPPYRLDVASDPAWMTAFARHADDVGFESLLAVEHVAVPVGYESRYPYSDTGKMPLPEACELPDPLDLLAWLAARTERLRLGTGILVLPEHHPLQLAKRCATIDRLSGGRLFLGVGVGWMREEFQLLEQPFEQRGPRTDEMIEVLRKLWGGGMVEHHGRFYDFPRLQMSPAPRAPIPILIGGVSDAALRRAGRIGDGWISDIHTSEELRGIVKKIREHRRAAGREGAPLEIVAAASDAFGVDGYRRLEEIGVTTVQTMPWLFYGGPTEALDKKLEGLRRFADDVISKLR
jgi:probable F420-dependent oxidoreductase